MSTETRSHTYLANADPGVIEDIYRQFLANPESIDLTWRKFFEGFDFARSMNGEVGGSAVASEKFVKESRVLAMIEEYRERGHLFTKTNPVRERRKYEDPLTLERFGLGESDLNTVFEAGREVGLGPARLRDIVQLLDETYCQSVAVEYMYIPHPKMRDWLRTRMESTRNRRNFTRDEQLQILDNITRTVVLEKFMHSRFVGQKRFSLEGVDAFIPAMDAIVELGANLGIEEFVIGMAHRGRLTILPNILGKELDHIFAEFEGKSYADNAFAGDVKYHLGHACERLTRSGKRVKLSVCPNPSHLEAVDPIVEGLVRAKLDHRYGSDLKRIAPIVVHGDASIAGQGVIYELLQMSTLDGYRTGGTVHVVLNNQVGFTTNYLDARSSTYCTDVAKVTLSPVFHVNGDDVEAVVYTVQLALEFRQQFNRDVFIDILGYRKYGHNEGDEPRFTQPILYKAIARHPNLLEIYSRKLIERGTLTEVEARRLQSDFQDLCQRKYEQAKQQPAELEPSFTEEVWQHYRLATAPDFVESPITGIELKTARKISEKLTDLPAGKAFFQKVVKILSDRRHLLDEHNKLDWAMGELLAYGSLVNEGRPVRITGQDVERGTFSHRHAILRIEDSEEEYCPLHHVSEQQASFQIYNSLLSEMAVLGFEYGFAMAMPEALTVWEAQFGDFANGAQIIIDQFVIGGEVKWKHQNGLVMLLPHGAEGQGPEHTSGRPERFLQLAADHNIQVVNCSTPANFFHALRRQFARPFRKPLIVLSPKSLLRHPLCVSPLEAFGPGTRFHELIDDAPADPKAVTRLILTSGKLYYQLLERRERDKRKDVALVRLEQYYPLPTEQLAAILQKYKAVKSTHWVQEEPENFGAWSYLRRKLTDYDLDVICRKESSSSASGFVEQHEREQAELTDRAFN
ncbi:2-oxoglutarate dehydrogenase E1 component [candidate division KSB1 bacterium]|nr:2-oxoglutarate dehydrogenase E1 component [candidate division KSB1 bacterium]